MGATTQPCTFPMCVCTPEQYQTATWQHCSSEEGGVQQMQVPSHFLTMFTTCVRAWAREREREINKEK